MATPPYVTAGTTIEETWGDQIAESVVNVFASAAARSSAIAVPVEGMVTYLTNEDRLYVYNGSAWERIAAGTTSGRTGCTISRSGQSVSSSLSFTNISFNTETFDSDGFFAPTSTTVTVPSGLDGLYAITFAVTSGFPTGGAPAGQDEAIRIIAGGTTYSSDRVSGRFSEGTMSIVVPLSATNTITAGVQQNAGTASFSATLHVYRIGA